jgi:hypothetical protein
MKKGSTKEGVISSKKISNALAQFEKKMIESNNDLERLIVLDDLSGIIDCEVDEWLNIQKSIEGKDDEDSDLLFKESIIQIADLTESQLKINEFIASMLPGAKKLAEVMKREGKKFKLTKSLGSDV